MSRWQRHSGDVAFETEREPMNQNTPDYDLIVARDVRVPMRDGVTLVTDLYLPARQEQALPGPWPALLARTPYDKGDRPAASAAFFARHGYLVAVQDCRGRYASEGRFFPFLDEPEDGYDTIQWLAAHPACDGQVGMWGGSHLAWVQFHAATQAPPALKTLIPHYGPTNAFHHSMREGGALRLWWIGWLRWLAGKGSHAARSAPYLGAALEAEPLLPWLAALPWRRGQSPLSTVPEYEEALLRLLQEERYSDFWRQPGLAMDEYFDRFPEIPILWIGGWYDYYPHAVSDSFRRFVALGRKDQYLLMGPWDHSGFSARSGDVWFGGDAAVRLPELQLAWFDYWLKGRGELPFRTPVRVFVMGDEPQTNRPRRSLRTADGLLDHGGAWREFAAWPPPEGEPRRFYLQPDGSLSPELPTSVAAATAYTYDPRDPVPSVGWCYVTDPASGYTVPPGPCNLLQPAPVLGGRQPGAPLTARRDVLVFTSAPLSEGLHLVGPIEACLWVSSDAPDTDFTARLCDLYPPSEEYPTGYAMPVGEGILRARFRESLLEGRPFPSSSAGASSSDRDGRRSQRPPSSGEGLRRSGGDLLEEGAKTVPPSAPRFGEIAEPRPLAPGEVTEIHITVSPTANRFRAGHRLRLDISSSNFPRFEPNRNTWTPDADPADRRFRVAENRVHHDAAHPSHLTVWVVPDRATVARR